MKIGIVSDTHDNVKKASAACEFLEENADLVVHCGDMVAPFTAEIFDRDFDFHCVRGNNDGEWNLKQTVEEFGSFHDNLARIDLEDISLAVYHGTDEDVVNGLAELDFDYVFRGHTHQKSIREVDGTLVINPGGIRLPGQDERLHVATVETGAGDVEFHRIEE